MFSTHLKSLCVLKRTRDAFVLVVILASFVLSASEARAAAFTVNAVSDTVDAVPGDGNCLDSAGNCTLRAAIGEANAFAGADTIALPAGIYTLTLNVTGEDANAGGDLDITAGSDITINGVGARTTIVQAGTIGGVDGNGTDRVFDVLPGGTLSLDSVTIRNGRASAAGGGFRTGGNLTVNHCTVADNRTTTSGGGGFEILTATNTTILNSTISGNSIGSSSGGGIRSIGSAQIFIANTTISRNTAAQTGGGGFRAQSGAGGLITMTNCTVTGNNLLTNTGGGLSSSNTFRIRNTIVAGNTAPGNPDVGATFASGGTNLIGVVGTSSGWITTGDNADLLNNTNARLGALTDQGGQTNVHALLLGSAAVNAGQNCVVDQTCATFNAPIPLTVDQRGLSRLYDGLIAAPRVLLVDIGAYERQPPNAASVTVSGRVTTGGNRGLARAFVYLTNENGETRATITNSFGYYRFADVSAGATYTCDVSAKRYNFAPQILNVTEEITNLDFVAQP